MAPDRRLDEAGGGFGGLGRGGGKRQGNGKGLPGHHGSLQIAGKSGVHPGSRNRRGGSAGMAVGAQAASASTWASPRVMAASPSKAMASAATNSTSVMPKKPSMWRR